MYHRLSHPSLVPAGVTSNFIVYTKVLLALVALVAIYVAFFYSVR